MVRSKPLEIIYIYWPCKCIFVHTTTINSIYIINTTIVTIDWSAIHKIYFKNCNSVEFLCTYARHTLDVIYIKCMISHFSSIRPCRVLAQPEAATDFLSLERRRAYAPRSGSPRSAAQTATKSWLQTKITRDKSIYSVYGVYMVYIWCIWYKSPSYSELLGL